MNRISYFGQDSSIFESLESLSKIKKSFLIKKVDLGKDKNSTNEILILDDSLKDFVKHLNHLSKINRNNLIVTAKKENINLSYPDNLRVFVKPIKILDLYKEILRKVKNNDSSFKININKSSLSLIGPTGKNLKLTEKEFKLISVLINSKGKALEKKTLLSNVWGLKIEKVDSLNTRVLETMISRIRKKINSADIKIKIIKNKTGYTLNY